MLSCFIDDIAFAFDSLSIGDSPPYHVGTYVDGQAILFLALYGSTDGGPVALTSWTFGGDTVDIQVSQPLGTGGGQAFGLYTGTTTSGSMSLGSSSGNGGAFTFTAWRITPYTSVHDTRNTSGNLTTVNGRAAVKRSISETTVTNPTTGSNISIGTNQIGISFD